MKYALISVYNKKGIGKFAKELNKLGFTIVSTGGTRRVIKDSGVDVVKRVSEITEFPEILDGRVKTLHPKLIAGILALRGKKKHLADLERFHINFFDLVVCNMYPFEEVIKKGAKMNIALENIDIGGPTMIRAAAKNFKSVVVIVSPRSYNRFLREYKKNGDISIETRKSLAVEAFKETAKYDKTIFRFIEKTQK